MALIGTIYTCGCTICTRIICAYFTYPVAPNRIYQIYIYRCTCLYNIMFVYDHVYAFFRRVLLCHLAYWFSRYFFIFFVNYMSTVRIYGRVFDVRDVRFKNDVYRRRSIYKYVYQCILLWNICTKYTIL